MTEKEKMLTGKYYLDCDPQLYAERDKVRDILWELNSLKPSMNDERLIIFNKLFGKFGKECFIETPFACDMGENIFFGDNSYAAMNCTFLDCAPIRIGKRVLIGPNVALYTVNHAFNSEERAQGYVRALPIEICDDVWLGGSVVILGGVKIGKSSIIGAGSVVTKDIPEGVIAVGNPCKVIRKITEQDKI